MMDFTLTLQSSAETTEKVTEQNINTAPFAFDQPLLGA